jgi:hypothetical protein
VIIKGQVLYALELVPGFLRLDELVHAFGFGFAALFAYRILHPSLGDRATGLAVSVL